MSIASDSERLLKKFKEENNFAVDMIVELKSQKNTAFTGLLPVEEEL